MATIENTRALPIICLMGPTASGKTDLSLYLADKLSCEIISVDSAMVYKTLDIGTAKPSREEQDRVSHHLIDIHDPGLPYSAAHFQKDATRIIQEIQAKDKIPVLVGGTMLYYKALQEGLSPLPCAHPEIRARLDQEAAEQGWENMHARLACVDPMAAEHIKPSDPQRIARALEVYEVTGKPLSMLWQEGGKDKQPFHFINVALIPNNRSALHEKIQQRFNQMLQQGFIEEVTQLYQRGDLHSDLPAIRSVGYRQAWEYLEGKIDYEHMCERAVIATRQLAKRQMTWLRNWDCAEYFDIETSALFKNVLHFVQNKYQRAKF